jgi:predicted PurR-regulated permease PerM
MTQDFERKIRIYGHMSIVVTFLVALVVMGHSFLIPLAFSFLFAIVFNPFVRFLERFRFPRVLAIVLVLLIFLTLLSGLIWLTALQLGQLMEDLPGIQQRIIDLFNTTLRDLESRLGVELLKTNDWWQNALEKAVPVVTNFVNTTSSVATFLVQVPIYVFLILLYREKFTRFLSAIWKEDGQAQSRTDEIKQVVQSYVSGLFIVILVLAVLNSVGLLILGIKYAIFFGIFSAVLTVIPYLGNFLGGLLPFLVALVTKDSAWYAVGVIAIYAVVQFLEGNFITPNIMGARVSVNPMAALVALIIGGQLLGIAGIILAIPALGIIKTLLAHSNTLWPWVLLIEDRNRERK